MPVYKESNSQIQLLRWFRLQYPDLADLLVGYPAGNKMNLLTAVRMKAMGLRPGMPDLQLLIPKIYYKTLAPSGMYFIKETTFCPGMFIEMKSERGKLSKLQKEFHNKLRTLHYTIVTCYSFEEAKCEIQKYLKPDTEH
jgi:hypothetical protein